jgi:cytochrome c oxidase subunit 4
MSHVAVPVSLYQRVFVTLITFTVVTILIALVDLGEWNAVIALTIASVKAGLVALYFMGLRWSNRVTRVGVAVALAGVVILFGASLNDDLTRDTKTYLPAELRPEMTDFSVQGLDGLTPEVAPPASAPAPGSDGH